MTVPGYLPYVVLAANVGIIAAVLLGLNAALRRATWPEREHKSAIQTAAAALVGWFLVAVLLASSGAYRGLPDRLPTIQFGLLVPIVVGAILIWRSPLVSRLIDAVPQHWIVAVEFYRVLGIIFLALYASSQVPGWFALPAGIGDIAVGLAAPFVARAYSRDPQRHGVTVLAWNLFGLGDLIVAVAMGFLTSPSPLQLFALDRPNQLLTAFPLVLIPTFAVPVSVLLHLASLTKLARGVAPIRSRPAVAAR